MSLPSPSEPTIRYATESDIPLILSLIHELASFEHAASSVQATHEKLHATLSFPIPSSASTSPPNTVEPSFTPGYARTLLIFAPDAATTSPANPSTSTQDSTPTPTPAGLALFFPNYSTWRAAPGIYLEDLYIRPAFRRRGYARLLFRELAREVLRIGGERLDWSVLKWNEGARGLYERGVRDGGVGAEALEEWLGMRVEGVERLGELVGGKEGG